MPPATSGLPLPNTRDFFPIAKKYMFFKETIRWTSWKKIRKFCFFIIRDFLFKTTSKENELLKNSHAVMQKTIFIKMIC